MKRNAIFALLIIVGFSNVFGQNSGVETSPENKNQTAESKLSNKLGKQIAKKNVIKNPWLSPSKRDYEAIMLDSDDLNKYAGFLQTPNTGLIRLHDAANCVANRNIIDVEEPCPSGFILGKATSYSFRAKKYRTTGFSDLLLHNKAFHAIGLHSQGILMNLGDVALENVSAQNPELKALITFIPSTDPVKATHEFQRFANGVRAGKYLYRKTFDVEKGKTYVLRAIAYKSKVYQQRGPFKVNILDNDKRDDVLIAFRVVDVNEDGSINLLWKELERKPAPKLIFEAPKATEKKN